MKALAIALWIGLAAAQQAELVTVQLIDDRFVPDKLAFRSGVLYRLRLENHGNEMHEFTAPEFFKAIEVKNPEVLEQGLPEVLLHPAESKDLYFVARHPGPYPLTSPDPHRTTIVGPI